MQDSTLSGIESAQIDNEAENARVFIFVNAAMGYGRNLAWEQQYCHNFWAGRAQYELDRMS